MNQLFLEPLDGTFSVLGTSSVFKKYLDGVRVYAFLPYWSIDGRKLDVSSVTDLAYFGLTVSGNGRIVTTDGNYKIWKDSKDLQKAISSVKKAGGRVSVTLIGHNDADIDAILSCKDCWIALVQDVTAELNRAEITDINVDFEYSGYTTREKSQSYSSLVGFLNTSLDKEFGGDAYVVVSTFADSVEKSERESVRLTDPKSLAENADALFIMAYDFHRPESAHAGPVAPLEGTYSTTGLNVTKALDGYLEVVPKTKLFLGLPFYGYDWVVESTKPRSARIQGNDLIGYSRVITYAQVLDLLIKKNLTKEWDAVAKTPYVNYVDEETQALRQVYFDDKDSLSYKVALAKSRGLLGVGVWALGYEGGYYDIWDIFAKR